MHKHVLLHGMILLMALNPLFAKFIHMPALSIIWGRLILAALVLGLVIKCIRRKSFKIKRKELFWAVVTGVGFGIHWWTYFESIQISTVAVALCALYTYPIITAIFEPWILGGRHRASEFLTSIMVTGGVIIMVPEWSMDNHIFVGIALGLLSALAFALRNLWTKKHLSHLTPDQSLFYQLICATVIFAPLLMQFEFKPTGNDLWFLLLSGLLITPLSHSLFIKTFEYFSMKTISVMTALQMIYSSIFAYLIFIEIPTVRTVIGGGIIFSAVVVETLWKKSS